MRRRSIPHLLIALSLGLITTHALAGQTPLVVGVSPQLSTRITISTYAPLRHYLKKHLQVPVHVYTAPNYKTFIRRMLDHKYDLVIAPPHLARLAQREANYVPMLRDRHGSSIVMVIARDNPAKDISDLRGTVIATPDELSLTNIEGLSWLAQRGLRPNEDFALLNLPSHFDAIAALQRGKSTAAITMTTPLTLMPQDISRSLRVFITMRDIPGLVYLANPRLSSKHIAHYTDILMQFNNESGRHSSVSKRFDTLQKIEDPDDLSSMDRYLDTLKMNLEQQP